MPSKLTPIAEIQGGPVSIFGEVAPLATPLQLLFSNDACVAYRLQSASERHVEDQPFWLKDDSGRVLIQGHYLLADLPSEEFILPKNNGEEEHYLFQGLRVGARVYAYGEPSKVPDPMGEPSLYREPPTALCLASLWGGPVIISQKPLGPRALLYWLSRRLFSPLLRSLASPKGGP